MGNTVTQVTPPQFTAVITLLGAETEVEVDMAADEPSLDLDLDKYREMAAEARRAAHRLCGLTEVVFI